MDEKRFETIYKQNGGFANPDLRILADRVTGMQYLVTMNGNQCSGITPLLDADGKPIRTRG